MSAKRSSEILRYWSALLKYQEALSARPRARRLEQQGEGRAPNLQQPSPGREYAKLSFEGAASFFVEKGRCEPLPWDAERTEFFENWLAQRYRRGENEEGALSELVLFPTVHLPRDELGGVLRFPVELEWLTPSGPFKPPLAEERAKGRYPAPPTQLRLLHPAREPEEVLPFFLDTGLLQRTLRVEAEEIDAYFARLRQLREVTPAAMVEATCVLLETPLDGERAAASAPAAAVQERAPAARLLARLTQAVQKRCHALGGRSRCYPVGLLVSTERVRATFHVQRDIAQAISALADKSLAPHAPLACYLGGTAPDLQREPCLGRWPGAPLTENQRHALELGLGSEFCAIQGPPGTGKTTLILNAVAHKLVEKATAIARTGHPGQSFLMVTSTNNRAVDNVIDPLSAGAYADFPLALRLGSREITTSVSARLLARLAAYVERAAEVDEEHFEQARRDFRARLEPLEQRLSSARRDLQAARARAQRKREIATLETKLCDSALALAAPESELSRALQALFAPEALPLREEAPYRREPGAARNEIAALIQALAQLSHDAEGDDDVALTRLELGFKRLARLRLPAVERWFGAPLALALPPRTAGARACCAEWEEALERCIAELLSLEAALATLAGLASDRARLEQLRAEESRDAAPRPAQTTTPEAADDDALEALTQQALELRDLWLRRNKSEIQSSVRAALAACTRSRSLRLLLDASGGPGLWLRRLFPCFGCTLLSLGNAFSNESPAFDQVIIDEAGQCHPAYVVSALLRARAATVIGDVHQLEPVIGLGREDERRVLRGLKLGVSEAEMQPYRAYDESGNSAQSLAERAVSGRPSLRDHFRCQAEIALLSEAWCGYGLVPRAAPASCRSLVAELKAPVLMTAIDGEQERYLGSYRNRREISEVTSWVRRLLAAGVSAAEIGVITPYRGQFDALLQTFRDENIPVERPLDELAEEATLQLFDSASAALALGTVHRFQGGERRIILLTTAITRGESLGFIDQRVHLLNVATSRAKEHLLVIGHAPTLSRGKHTRLLVEAATPLSPLASAAATSA